MFTLRKGLLNKTQNVYSNKNLYSNGTLEKEKRQMKDTQYKLLTKKKILNM